MGDEGWANRGESLATLGSVGISLRHLETRERDEGFRAVPGRIPQNW